MAHRILPFYNVDAAVGPGRPNKIDDVMLVQFFIKEIHDFNAPMNQLTTFPDEPLSVDGNANQNLFDWILAFQELAKQMGGQVVKDGAVDSVPGFSMTRTQLTHSIYTIIIMNNFFLGQQPAIYPKLWEHPRIPQALSLALFTNFK
jgi:hypothetical protein